ncbi:hypothetical protein O3P69_003788 [Scylla paramamosain]|uniref:Uncharacterized protein n=1 Tax=Scylla paramamosain TaxID=85552 RepID=A0AAW0UE52_SCYPA
MLPRVRFPWITPLITTGHECQGDTTLHHPTCCLYHTWEHHLEYQLSRYSPQPSQPILPPPVPTSTRPSSLKVCGSCQEQQEPCCWMLELRGVPSLRTATPLNHLPCSAGLTSSSPVLQHSLTVMIKAIIHFTSVTPLVLEDTGLTTEELGPLLQL